MTNPLDRSLKDMKRDEEVIKMSADMEALERLDIDELEQLGRRINHAYRLSGESPSLAALEWADEKVDLPPMRVEDIAHFTAELRRRIESKLMEKNRAQNLGALIEKARRVAGIDERSAAGIVGLPVPAYQQLEQARMPVWRTPASKLARLCHILGIDGSLVIRWASIVSPASAGAAFGRLDVADDTRGALLSKLAEDANQQADKEFSRWRHEFIDAYQSSSRGDAPLGR